MAFILLKSWDLYSHSCVGRELILCIDLAMLSLKMKGNLSNLNCPKNKIY